ncbi:MAG TPA: TonB family protein [Vicinamibacteria bacterium]
MPQALLVDDDEPFLAALAEAVSRESFSTRTATSLAAAKMAIAGGAPDVVLIDLHLPDGNGMELLEELSAFPATEVVLITGNASVETAVEALRRGASDYLVKPLDLGRIKTVLANVSRTRELKLLAASLPWARRTTSEDGLPVVFGRYEVEAEIGEGAMGRVFRCRDPLVGRLVAVKTVKSEYLTGETRAEYLRRFRREAQAAGILSHPGIVGIYDVGGDYMVMEYVEGATLQDLLRDQRALGFPSALRVLAPLAEALDYAHQAGVIHRDIKPSNIMVQPDGRPKLMDFGVARLESSTATRSGRVLGSPSYMAPEQILGEAPTPQADLFSFAVVAYEALTGRRPFAGDLVPSIVYRVVHEPAPAPCGLNRELPAACDAVFARALAKKRDERYPDATSFVAALMGADAGTGMPAISPDPLLKSLVYSMSSAASPAPGAEHLATPAPQATAATGPAASPTTTLNASMLRLRSAAQGHWRQGLAAGLAVVAALAVSSWATRPPAPEAGPSGPLRIETQPPGMAIWIDGRPAGRSPLVRALAPGNHHLKVFEPGYAPAELSLQLSTGTTAAPLRFVMAREAPRADAVRPAPPPPAATRVRTREGELVELTAGVRPPRRVSGETPRYPDEARHLRMSGSVLVEMIVTERGEPEQVRVLESAGAVLDATVTEAISSWRFEPAVRDGVKVRVRWQYRHTFSPR